MSRFLFALLAMLWPVVSSAHEVRPSFLELRETVPGEFSVLWKTPMLGDARLALARRVPGVGSRAPEGARYGVAGRMHSNGRAVAPLAGVRRDSPLDEPRVRSP